MSSTSAASATAIISSSADAPCGAAGRRSSWQSRSCSTGTSGSELALYQHQRMGASSFETAQERLLTMKVRDLARIPILILTSIARRCVSKDGGTENVVGPSG